MRVSSVFAASALCIALLAGSGRAQVPTSSAPVLGFMPPYEITRTVRRAGFDPLAPPLREGSTYVVRATDYRGILMRVVVDARSGAIRDATRIVPGPGSGPQIGMVPYEPIPNERPVLPPDYDAAPVDDGEMLPPRTPAAHPVTRASVTILPPLPRPRPPELASRKSTEDPKPSAAKPAAVTDTKPDTKLDAKVDAKPEQPAAEAKPPEKSEAKSEVTGSSAVAAPPSGSAPPAAAPAPQAPPVPATAAVKPAKSGAPPPIND